jgi:hypothetical protein
MKIGILFLLLAFSFSAGSQSLKDLLYSGKLKKDSTGVIRKTDDLSTKIDTVQKKAPEEEKSTAKTDTTVKAVLLKKVDEDDNDGIETIDSAAVATIPDPVKAPVKSPNSIWKEYINEQTESIKTEILSNKKIKKETYYLTVEYEIGTEGDVNVLKVISSPENALLQSQIMERFMNNPPKMNPVPKKVKRKYNFNITKD